MLPNALLFPYHVQHVTPSSKAFLSVYALGSDRLRHSLPFPCQFAMRGMDELAMFMKTMFATHVTSQ